MKNNSQPVNVTHLGKKSRKEIKKFKKGYGKLFLEVQQVIDRAKSTAPAGNDVLPVVVSFRQKNKNSVPKPSLF